MDSYLIWHLTGGRVHATDVTNASRTMLMDLRTLGLGRRPLRVLRRADRNIARNPPELRGFWARRWASATCPTACRSPGSPATSRRRWWARVASRAGQAKCTYGTGAFLLAHTGSTPVPSTRGLVTTAAASLDGGPPQYALEGSVFVAGAAVQWFRDGLKAVGAAPEIGGLSDAADPDSEVLFVPALTGLGAPHWQPEARGTIFGLTRATSLADLARATLEGVAFQVADLIDAIEADLPGPSAEFRVDGGMARSDPFLQFQADLLGPADRPQPAERIDGPGRGHPGGPGGGAVARSADAAAALLAQAGEASARARRGLAIVRAGTMAARGGDGQGALSASSESPSTPRWRQPARLVAASRSSVVGGW